MIFCIVTVSLLIGIYLYRKLQQKRSIPQEKKIIPIEKGLPIIGIVNKIERPLCNYLWKLTQKHGPIYRVKIGMRDIVVLNTFEYIKAALVENRFALSGRWKSFKYLFVTNNSGLGFIDGKDWSEQRSFVSRTLREFGFGKSRSTEIVQEECVRLLEEMGKFEGESVNILKFMSIYTVNVICKFVMNKRFTKGEPDFDFIEKYMLTTADRNDPISNLFLMFPFIENNDWLSRFLIWVTSRKSFFEGCHDLFRRNINEHRSNVDFHSDGDNLMDRFLIKQRQVKENKGNVESFTDFQLVKNGLELLTAGFDTTSSLLVWSFMFMGMYPEVQNKVHKEIIDKIGSERLPTMNDKTSLDYTQAMMDEVMRVSSVVPLGLFHRTLNDVNLKGYFISKDTVVIPNIFACHLDENVWEKPFEFYPDHFLSPDSNGVMKYSSKDELIPFSMGKRQCLAESLARIEYFIFYTSILQRFQVTLVNEEVSFDVFCANEGIVRMPPVSDFIFTERL